MDQVLFSEAIGTTGYKDPSIEKTGGVTHKSDIYSFGVVLWEVLYRRKSFILDEFDRFLAPLARFHDENRTLEVIEPHLYNQIGRKSARTFLSLAYSCSNYERAQRPDMNYVVKELEKALELQLQYQSLYRPNLEQSTSKVSHLKIRLADINLATHNFSHSYFYLGSKFYDVYRAELELWDIKSSTFCRREE
ncbi:probable serine/threonine-protein kinase PBL8 [Rutidosis leptorrhynchoides]|uniref:probable serine/threonine-protein kinase PBL8 n=1 Tax=Rutidosis leptorrhynchoides TaxID=125765 RepID=UPI003A99F456